MFCQNILATAGGRLICFCIGLHGLVSLGSPCSWIHVSWALFPWTYCFGFLAYGHAGILVRAAIGILGPRIWLWWMVKSAKKERIFSWIQNPEPCNKVELFVLFFCTRKIEFWFRFKIGTLWIFTWTTNFWEVIETLKCSGLKSWKKDSFGFSKTRFFSRKSLPGKNTSKSGKQGT